MVFVLQGCGQPAQEQQAPADNEQRISAAYGSWASPLGAAEVYGSASAIGELQSVGDAIYFSESSPAEGGKVGIKRLEKDGSITSVVAPAFGVGSRVHEYGGGDFLGIGQSLFVTKGQDQLFYRIAPNQEALALTPNGTRHGECISYPKGSRIICVREDHRQPGEPKASLVTINLNFSGEGDIFVDGHDFISSPAINADNTQLAWITWEHPNMPWDNTQLWLGDLNRKGQLTNIRQIAPERKGALMQPLFSPNGVLYFIADYDNWWNLYRLDGKGDIEQVTQLKAEIGGPAWKLGQHAYAFENENTLIASFNKEGDAGLLRLDLQTGVIEVLAADFADIKQVVQGADGVYFVGSRPTPERGIYKVSGRGTELVYAPKICGLDPRYISRAVNVEFTTKGGGKAHGYFYPPVNGDYQPLPDTRPPLLMMLHGGPTASANRAYDSAIQYWTSRGFAVFELNYRGSTGFGRQYRQSLYGNWGKADVEDAVWAAGFLVDQGWVNAEKLAIRGGSAGGLSVLSALAFHDKFKAGVSYFGISDIEVLGKETHKFESRYLDQLIGPYPEMKAVYRERSPLYHLQGFNEPLLLLQGLEDKVVPPSQSQHIYKALKDKGVPTAFIGIEGEGHGFRQPHNKILALESELVFYGMVFDFTPAGTLPALKLDNAAALARPGQQVE
ncbi:S9 family peptidase [Shewanella indica]|uniref:S9 family peptidase n=2 Tax=Shewanellaceae TaxID=267890 RepID=A0ABU4QJC4_9GAMM|nr:S9 family peptidase [Shewanella indica]MDX6017441.1 S9 family peptidase [Shewanella indica]